LDSQARSQLTQQLAFSLSLLISIFPQSLTTYYKKIGSPSDFDCYTLVFRDIKRVKRRSGNGGSVPHQNGAGDRTLAGPQEDDQRYEVVIPFHAYHSWTHASKLSLVSDENSTVDPSIIRSGDARRIKQRHLLREKLQSDPVLKDALRQIGREAHGQVVYNLKTMDITCWKHFFLSMDWGYFNRWKNRRLALVERVRLDEHRFTWHMGFTMYGDMHSHMATLNGRCDVDDDEAHNAPSGGTSARTVVNHGSGRNGSDVPSRTSSRPSIMGSASRSTRPSILQSLSRSTRPSIMQSLSRPPLPNRTNATGHHGETQQQGGIFSNTTLQQHAQETSPDDDVNLFRNERILSQTLQSMSDTHISSGVEQQDDGFKTQDHREGQAEAMERDAIDALRALKK